MELITRYFPSLGDGQLNQLQRFMELLSEWNQKINLISRQDMENLEERHILHAMAIARWMRFNAGTDVLDLGTGGGIPGIPMAILFPESNFTLIDARGKKIKVVQEMVSELGLTNVRAFHQRAEEMKEKFDFVISRAVSSLEQVWGWARPLIHLTHRNAIPNGLVIFKGGKFRDELNALPKKTYHEVQPISQYFREPFFEEKYLVYLQR